MMERNQHTLLQLHNAGIYPKQKLHCHSTGVYLMASNDDTYAGSTLKSESPNSFKIRNHNRFYAQEKHANEKKSKFIDPKDWRFVPVGSTDTIKDLILEDVIIMLMNTNMNRMLNVFHSFHSPQILCCLAQEPELEKVYTSEPFVQFLTQISPGSMTLVNVQQLISELLPSVTFSTNPHFRSWNKLPPAEIAKHRDFNSILNKNAQKVYARIKDTGSKGSEKHRIFQNEIYGFADKTANEWMLYEYRDELYDVCDNNCEACLAFQAFIKSDYKEMIASIDQASEKHLLASILRQFLPAIRTSCLGTSKDALSRQERDVKCTFHYVEFAKINVERRDRLPFNPKHLHSTCKLQHDYFNSRNQMYDKPGTHPCLSENNKPDTCHTCPMVSENQTHPYFEALNLKHITSTTCRSVGVYSLIHKNKQLAYWGSTARTFSKRQTYRWTDIYERGKFGPQEDWWFFGLGTTNSRQLDFLVEDALLLLFLDQSNFDHKLNKTLNIFDPYYRHNILQALRDPRAAGYGGLFKKKILFNFLFKKNLRAVNPVL